MCSSDLHYSAEHIQARIGGVLIYFLDHLAVQAFTAAAAAAGDRAGQVFTHTHATGLPAQLRHPGQDLSLIVRLRGPQDPSEPLAMTTAASLDGQALVGCRVGGLLLLIRDAEAMHRLTHLAATVARVAAALWPLTDTSAEADQQPTRPRGQLAR